MQREVWKELIRWVTKIVVRTPPFYWVTPVAVPQRAAPNKGIAASNHPNVLAQDVTIFLTDIKYAFDTVVYRFLPK